MRWLDPAAGPVERFAYELRELRSSAGDPPFWKMARRCPVSKSSLAAAAAGYMLPTESVLREFVALCDGDWPWWQDRLRQAHTELAARDAQNTDAVAGQGTGALVLYRPPAVPALVPRRGGRTEIAPLSYGGHQHRQRRARSAKLRPAAAALAVATVAAGAVAGAALSGMWRSADRPKGPSPSTAAGKPPVRKLITVNDGDDPRVDGCASANDVQNAALGSVHNPYVPIADSRGYVIGALGIWHNARCGAAWAEVSYVDPGLHTATLTLHRPADGAAVATQVTANLPHDAAIGLLLRTGLGCVWAQVRVDIPGGAPITAKTPCET